MPRPFSSYMDSLLDAEPVKILDHGFIRLVDYMGNEDSIVQAARVSYNQPARSVIEDIGLLRYMLRHRHNTPFEMCEIKLHVKLPIFIARQWIRHRTANVNEQSARYSILDSEFYIPDLEQMRGQSVSNKQGRNDNLITDAAGARERIQTHNTLAYNLYDALVSDPNGPDPGDGLTKELARMVLPLSVYTQWYWKIDLHNLLHFLSLRYDPHAQYEIRVYAETIWKWVTGWVPNVAEAFEEYRLLAVTFSAKEQQILRSRLLDSNFLVAQNHADVCALLPNKREREEFIAKLNQILG